MPQAQKVVQAPVAETAASVIDVAKVRAAKLQTDPYEYLVVSGFIRPEWMVEIEAEVMEA